MCFSRISVFSANNKNQKQRIPLTMPMKNKVFIAMLLVCALTSAAVYGALAQGESLLGVKAGDNFTYSFEVYWSSTNPSKIVPQEFSNMNQTLSIHFNVTDVGSTIPNVTNVAYV